MPKNYRDGSEWRRLAFGGIKGSAFESFLSKGNGAGKGGTGTVWKVLILSPYYSNKRGELGRGKYSPSTLKNWYHSSFRTISLIAIKGQMLALILG